MQQSFKPIMNSKAPEADCFQGFLQYTLLHSPVMATPLLPPPLKHLLEELESPSPSIRTLPANLATSDDFGDYFQLGMDDQVPQDKQWWQVRLRVFTAIGNCCTLTNIRLHFYGSGIRRVQEAEARALLEGLLSNPVLEVLDVSWWDGFGTVAACEALARILRCTRSLHQLSLHGVGMTSEGLGHIAAGLEANPSSPLRSLNLGRNGIGDVSGAQHLAHILATTPTLESLSIHGIHRMDVAGAEVIANALAHNATLRKLFIGDYQINDPIESAPLSKLVLGALSAPTGSQGTPSSAAFNHSITHLSLCVSKMALPGGAGLLGEAVAQMLRTNTTLTSLSITGNFLSHGLDALAHNTSITHLVFRKCHDDVEMEMLIPIVGGSGTLKELHLSGLGNTTASFKRALFRWLEENPSIESLVLDGWDGLNDDMYRDLMHSLQVNTNLHRISCDNTSWKSQGKDAAIQQALKRNARRVAYLSLAQHADVEFTDPKHGRLFLCGSGFAGKTTLRKQLIRSCLTMPQRLKRRSLHWWRRTEGIEIEVLCNDPAMQITIWDLAGQDQFRALQDHLFPNINQACIFFFVFSPFDHTTHKVKDNWDEKLEDDLRHWLRFIVSKCSTQGHTLPQVYVILTHLDKMSGVSSEKMLKWANPTISKVREEYVEVLDILQVFALNARASSKRSISLVLEKTFERFQFLLSKKLPRVPQPCIHMGGILGQWIWENPTRPIMRLHEFQDLCHREVTHLQKLTKEDERAVNIRHAISSYLHDVGTIIYFKGLDFLVVNPNWVTHVFLGHLIKFGEGLQSSKTMMPPCRDGFVTKAHLQEVLERFLSDKKYQGFDQEDLIHLLLKLELCYKQIPKVSGSIECANYFVPSALDDANGKALKGERQLEWLLGQQPEVDSMHIGRRLQCKDKLRTFLGPGFFPRLQVRLRNRLFEKMGGKMKAEQYTNRRNWITFYIDGIEVLVESPHDIAYYVDILVRSHKTREQTIAFLTEHVVEEIQSFCASAQGSPGVTLVEGIIRPTCVSLLTLCTHRRSQVVFKEELISCILAGEKVMMDGEIFSCKGSFDYKHSWIPVLEVGLGAEFERAQDLLDPGDLLEVLNKKERMVEQQLSSIDEAARVVLAPTNSNNHGRAEITTTGGQRHNTRPVLAHTMSDNTGPSHRTVISHYCFDKLNIKVDDLREQTLQKLGDIQALQEQTLQKVEDLRTLQERTLATVLSRIDQIMNFSAQLVESDIPRRPYFTTKDVGMGHRLVAAIRIGKAVMLHFMCEGTGENLSHGVRGQVGYELIMEDAEWDGIRSIVVNSVRLMAFLAKAGLHVAAGIGGAIPDYVSWGGATAVTGTALLGESLLKDLNSQLPGTSLEQSRCMEDEWWRFKEVLKTSLEGQMTKLFGLYRARFTRDYKRGVAWVCDECLKRGKSKRILEPL